MRSPSRSETRGGSTSINTHIGRAAAVTFLSLLLIDAGSLYAQGKPAPERLRTATGATCEFTLLAVGTWTNGEPHVALKTLTPPLRLEFNRINTDEGTSQMIGRFSSTFDVIARLAAGTLHFIQMYHGAPLYVTTIFPKVSRGDKLKAVHSRHEAVDVALSGFTSSPEQYYGECDVTP